jgi:hypothetical protein
LVRQSQSEIGVVINEWIPAIQGPQKNNPGIFPQGLIPVDCGTMSGKILGTKIPAVGELIGCPGASFGQKIPHAFTHGNALQEFLDEFPAANFFQGKIRLATDMARLMKIVEKIDHPPVLISIQT